MGGAPVATLTILGSGTFLPSRTRRSAAHHLADGPLSLLLDCGPGTLHGLAATGIPWRSITHLAISHLHLDHVGDLPSLLFAMRHGSSPSRCEPMTLLGPRGFAAYLDGVARALDPHLFEIPIPLRVVEIGDGEVFEDVAFGLEVRAHPTPHADPSIAYRVSGPSGVVGYTGDTGPSERLGRFLEGCDVLVSECALSDPPGMDRHLSPRGVSALARLATPGLLILTHVYPPSSPAEAARRVAKEYGGRVLEGSDGMRITLGAAGVRVER